jgi:hypothetical protein
VFFIDSFVYFKYDITFRDDKCKKHHTDNSDWGLESEMEDGAWHIGRGFSVNIYNIMFNLEVRK